MDVDVDGRLLLPGTELETRRDFQQNMQHFVGDGVKTAEDRLASFHDVFPPEATIGERWRENDRKGSLIFTTTTTTTTRMSYLILNNNYERHLGYSIRLGRKW